MLTSWARLFLHLQNVLSLFLEFLCFSCIEILYYFIPDDLLSFPCYPVSLAELTDSLNLVLNFADLELQWMLVGPGAHLDLESHNQWGQCRLNWERYRLSRALAT